jgi:hypothetical protein
MFLFNLNNNNTVVTVVLNFAAASSFLKTIVEIVVACSGACAAGASVIACVQDIGMGNMHFVAAARMFVVN